MRHATVTLTLREEDARWLNNFMALVLKNRVCYQETLLAKAGRIMVECRHALAECECGEET